MDEATNQICLNGDDHLALTLMTMWALFTGRAMPGGSPHHLTEQQLIDFWAE